MNTPFERIGLALMNSLPLDDAHIILISETTPGDPDRCAVSLYVRYPNTQALRQEPAALSVVDEVSTLWRVGYMSESATIQPLSWQTMEFFLLAGSFNVEFIYPDRIAPAEGRDARLTRLLDRRFPGMKVVHAA